MVLCGCSSPVAGALEGPRYGRGVPAENPGWGLYRTLRRWPLNLVQIGSLVEEDEHRNRQTDGRPIMLFYLHMCRYAKVLKNR